MRNVRGALRALAVAGAAYAWRNRAQLRQQFNSLSQRRAPRQLPDYRSTDRSLPDSSGSVTPSRETQFGGSDV